MPKHSIHTVLLCSVLVMLSRSAAAGDEASSGDPNWFKRGSANISSEDGRVFYALGSAPRVDGQSGESQRDSADGAARTEAIKSITAFISALQTYNTADAQNTMIAMQSLQGPLLQGVRIADRLVQGDGRLVSLASFDLASVQAVLVRAKDRGLILGDVEPRGLHDMFDKTATKWGVIPAVVAVHDSSFGDDSIKGDSSKIKPLGGLKPSWADGNASPRVPSTVYWCGTGKAGRRGSAEDAGNNVLTQILKKSAEATLAAFTAASAKDGVPAVQDAEDIAKAVVATVLPAITVQEIWVDPKGPTYALVCLERVPTGAALRKLIAEDEKKVNEALAAVAKGEGKEAQRAAAASALLHREIANSLVRAMAFSQVGAAASITLGQLGDAFKPGFTPIKVAVKADGPYWLGFANAMVVGMAGKGYQVGLAAVTPKPDILVSAVISLNDDKGAAVAAEGSATVDIKDVSQGKALGSLKESDKASDKNRFDSERGVVRKLADKLSKQAAEKIGIKK